MLTSSYIHIRGVSALGERSLWEQGALSWDAFLAAPERWVADGADLRKVERAVEMSQKNLTSGNYQYFASRFPRREHWRAFPEFRDSAAFLDIETSGRGNEITVIGLYDGLDYTAYVQGENIMDFEDAISRYSMVVTFFGTGFDLPVLRSQFPNVSWDHLHIDLCPTLRRLGFVGGLKSIERQFGIERSAATKGLTGRDAVYLWRQSRRGSKEAMSRLIEYNKEDVVNLEQLMEAAYFELREWTMGTLVASA
jgi:uncharacterized protein YprB with RNaseH-like and TPR domain